jgi:hypothetical protein
MRRTLVFWLGLCLVSLQVRAADFYVDPGSHKAKSDGSAKKPWKSLQEVFDNGLVESQHWDKLPYTDQSKFVVSNLGAPVKAGDTIWLRSGYYGDVLIDSYYNMGNITIAAEPGATPELSSLHIRSSAHWTIRGLSFSAEYSPTYQRRTLVFLESHNWRGPVQDIVVEQCSLCSVADASRWTAADWDRLSCDGIDASGSRITLQDNYLLNVNFGICVWASDSYIGSNVVENFAGDGLRGLGNYCTFEYNTVKNSYKVNENHDDGFQSWSVGPGGVGTGEVVGVVLRGNTIISYVDPDQPHHGALQGIGCFDGTFVDWVVVNNVIITDHWHGITLLGARNCLVINNTVINRSNSTVGPPWICIGEHKDGTPPVDCVVRNNLATDFGDAKCVLEENNLRIQNAAAAAALFVDPYNFNLHLLPGALAIDAGSSVDAPRFDHDGTPRPQGKGFDIGAYEWRP